MGIKSNVDDCKYKYLGYAAMEFQNMTIVLTKVIDACYIQQPIDVTDRFLLGES